MHTVVTPLKLCDADNSQKYILFIVMVHVVQEILIFMFFNVVATFKRCIRVSVS